MQCCRCVNRGGFCVSHPRHLSVFCSFQAPAPQWLERQKTALKPVCTVRTCAKTNVETSDERSKGRICCAFVFTISPYKRFSCPQSGRTVIESRRPQGKTRGTHPLRLCPAAAGLASLGSLRTRTRLPARPVSTLVASSSFAPSPPPESVTLRSDRIGLCQRGPARSCGVWGTRFTQLPAPHYRPPPTPVSARIKQLTTPAQLL